jgi:hypothetical protein
VVIQLYHEEVFLSKKKMEGKMGEVEKTLERLNKVLVEAGFPTVELGVIGDAGDFWYQGASLTLRYDKDGKYIEPEGGEYR